VLGHRFAEKALLRLALTHRSRVNEEGGRGVGNERLEFLGDAVLDLAISELLMERSPDADEGRLSRARAELVNTRALARHAQHLGLDRSVRLGRGEARSAGRRKASILANVFEAVLAALYLDGGLEPVRALVEREFGALLDDPALFEADPKTRLQELLQAAGRPIPVYATTRTEGPDHAREFHVEVRVEDEVVGRGVGGSKREAEQQAASQALEHLAEP
jgi:ribonuclease-3